MTNIVEILNVKAGEPIRENGYEFYPLFNEVATSVAYVSLAEALRRGAESNKSFVITEVSEAGSVNRLLLVNSLDVNVLILDGEQLKGAKQNRTLNITILAGAGKRIQIPVSCVERGRWHREAKHDFSKFDDSDMPSDLRSNKLKGVFMKLPLKSPGQAKPRYDSDQMEVWNRIYAKHRAANVSSRTDSLTDIVRSDKFRMAKEVSLKLKLAENQTGVIAFRHGIFIGLDYISEPKVFADNFVSLLRSYLLTDVEFIYPVYFQGGEVIDWLRVNLSQIPQKHFPGVDLGNNWMGESVILFSALEYEGQIVHMTALPQFRGSSRKNVSNSGPIDDTF